MQKLKLCISILLVMILSFSLLVPSLAEDSIYVWSTNSKEIDENIINVNSDNNLQDDNAPSNSLNLESGSAILIEQSTGQILYEHNMHEKLRPASVTKVMSILLIMEAIDSGKISLTDNVYGWFSNMA